MSNTLITEKQIQYRLNEIAKQINEKFDKVTLLITLTGAVYTGVDLSKYITVPCKIEFVKLSSYGHEQNAGIVQLKYCSIDRGEHLDNLIIIDDVFDTGNTLDFLVKYINNNFTYDTLSTMMLLDKPYRREKDYEIDFVGFTIKDEFVYGYGLDLKDYERNLTEIRYV